MIAKRRKRNHFKQKTSFSTGLWVGLFLGVSGTLTFIEFIEPQPETLEKPLQAHVCFSPEGRCESQVLKAISFAKQSIKVQAYALTSHPIAEALIDAKERGVDVTLIVDSSQLKSKYSQIPKLLQYGIPIYVDKVSGIAHNKVMIIDDHVLLTGSYNWSNAAHKRNAENLLFLRDSGLIRLYLQNWEGRLSQSKPLLKRSREA